MSSTTVARHPRVGVPGLAVPGAGDRPVPYPEEK